MLGAGCWAGHNCKTAISTSLTEYVPKGISSSTQKVCRQSTYSSALTSERVGFFPSAHSTKRLKTEDEVKGGVYLLHCRIVHLVFVLIWKEVWKKKKKDYLFLTHLLLAIFTYFYYLTWMLLFDTVRAHSS